MPVKCPIVFLLQQVPCSSNGGCRSMLLLIAFAERIDLGMTCFCAATSFQIWFYTKHGGATAHVSVARGLMQI